MMWRDCPERSTDRFEVQLDHDALDQLPDRKYRYRVRSEPIDPPRPWWNGLPPLTSTQFPASRVSTEISHGWMANNPELGVDSIRRFQEEHPITEWVHRVDMSLRGFTKLIAIRREKPITMDDYLADNGPYLKEIGMK